MKLILRLFVAANLLLVFSSGLRAQNPGDVLFGMPGIHTVEISFTQPGWWDTLVNNKILTEQRPDLGVLPHY